MYRYSIQYLPNHHEKKKKNETKQNLVIQFSNEETEASKCQNGI